MRLDNQSFDFYLYVYICVYLNITETNIYTCRMKNRLMKLYTYGYSFVTDKNQVVEIKAYTKNEL